MGSSFSMAFLLSGRRSRRHQVSLLTEAGDTCLPQPFAGHRSRGEAQHVLVFLQHLSGASPGNISTAGGKGCSRGSVLLQLMSRLWGRRQLHTGQVHLARCRSAKAGREGGSGTPHTLSHGVLLLQEGSGL